MNPTCFPARSRPRPGVEYDATAELEVWRDVLKKAQTDRVAAATS